MPTKFSINNPNIRQFPISEVMATVKEVIRGKYPELTDIEFDVQLTNQYGDKMDLANHRLKVISVI